MGRNEGAWGGRAEARRHARCAIGMPARCTADIAKGGRLTSRYISAVWGGALGRRVVLRLCAAQVLTLGAGRVLRHWMRQAGGRFCCTIGMHRS